MNKRKAKKMRKKQDMFIDWFAKSYREVKEHDRAYHEFVVADRRRCKEECFDVEFDFDEVRIYEKGIMDLPSAEMVWLD
jgi:hypothetical protein